MQPLASTGWPRRAKDGVHAAGGYPLEFGTISVSDGISMGHEGMHFSLVSREVIADSVETVFEAERLDGGVLLAGCDKSDARHAHGRRAARPRRGVPLRRVDPARPASATRTSRSSTRSRRSAPAPAGSSPARRSTRSSARSARARAPAAACTPPTRWPSAAEALGMSLPGSAAPPAVDRRRDGYARRSGEAVVELLRRGITARATSSPGRRSRTRSPSSWRSAARPTPCCTCWRSRTRPRSHLELDDFNRIGDRVPHLADVKPFGQYVMTDVDRIGGVPVVMKALLDAGLLHGDALTVTGRTMAENLAELDPPDPDGEIMRALVDPDPPHRRPDDPARLAGARGRRGEDGGLRRGRVRGHGPGLRRRGAGDGRGRGRHHHRPATSSSSATRARRAARGCARCWRSPAPSRAPASARTCCSLTDGRFSGGTTGLCIGHVAPEAVDGGPIAFVRDGDRIRARRRGPHARPARRRRRAGRSGAHGYAPPPPRYTRGVLAKYARLVGSAARRRCLRLSR